MSKAIHWRKRRRIHLMFWAMLHHDARKEYRAAAWLYLLEWAALGGTPDEVPGLTGEAANG